MPATALEGQRWRRRGSKIKTRVRRGLEATLRAVRRSWRQASLSGWRPPTLPSRRCALRLGMCKVCFSTVGTHAEKQIHGTGNCTDADTCLLFVMRRDILHRNVGAAEGDWRSSGVRLVEVVLGRAGFADVATGGCVIRRVGAHVPLQFDVQRRKAMADARAWGHPSPSDPASGESGRLQHDARCG